MNIFQRLIDQGIQYHSNAIQQKHARVTNWVALIVCAFVIQNFGIAWFYAEIQLLPILGIHGILISLVFVFNHYGKRVTASAWFSSIALIFVTLYCLLYPLDTNTVFYLPIIIFLQFFLFSRSEKTLALMFVVIAILCLTGAVLWHSLVPEPLISLHEGYSRAQRWNSFIGTPILSFIFGIYAFNTINRAEKEAEHERDKTEQLLLNILPQSVARRLKDDRSLLAERFDSVTVLFADIVDFTRLSERLQPQQLIEFLNDIFSKFDRITEAHSLEKIKTIGDAYMVAGGVPIVSSHHVKDICHMALEMQEVVKQLESPTGDSIRIRIGINTGPVTAGVIGMKKFSYDLWGDTVNTASRMESHAEDGNIQITQEVYDVVRHDFECTPRGVLPIKGKGNMMTYFLTGIKK